VPQTIHLASCQKYDYLNTCLANCFMQMCRNAAAAIFGKARESWWPTPSLPEMCKSIGIATENRKYGETIALWFPIKQCVGFFV
jgi:hypothetical protein